MSLDITYRPVRYADILGQESTIAILREYVRSGRGFQQSYLFCGGHGSGKTTLGRILARALLCEAPQNGDPCDQCHSCKSLLTNGTSQDFVEVDAATNSGKDSIKAITDEIAYATFSGKRRIYLFDESHQLTPGALDALLKYLEDTFPGSKDKKLTCIFCTTEPEKMRATVLSRCAPAFVVQPQKPAHIAQRLADICQKEGIDADPAMLVLIAEVTECHIRDALKAVEGVSMLGAISKENVTAYLHLDLNSAYIDLLAAIGVDLNAALTIAKTLMQRVSPGVCYGKLTDVAMLAFQVHLGETATGFWNLESLQRLAARGHALLGFAARFASRPGRLTSAMLLMDIASLHHVGGQVRAPTSVVQVQMVPATAVPVVQASTKPLVSPVEQERVLVPATPSGASSISENDAKGDTVEERDRDWLVDPRLQGKRDKAVPLIVVPSGSSISPDLSVSDFVMMLGKSLAERTSSGRSA